MHRTSKLWNVLGGLMIVCLTATKVKGNQFQVDVIRETLQATNLGELQVGSLVNIERSLKHGYDVSGHFVTGHIDGRGLIQKISKRGRDRLFQIKSPKKLMTFFASKGSVAVDGISLTIQSVKKGCFEVALIPHTLKETTLGSKKAGEFVNLEVDLIARYLQKIIKNHKIYPSNIIFLLYVCFLHYI